MFYVGPKCRIFVSIAAYRDNDAPKTVRNLLETADRPHMLKVGILNQIDSLVDRDCLVGNTGNVHEIQTEAYSSKGACWARSRIMQEMLTTEDFYLQIDSHSRFDQGWDTTLIRMYEEAANPHIVFSCYPAGFDRTTEVRSPQGLTRFSCKKFDDDGLPRFGSDILQELHERVPYRTMSIAGGCLFTRADTVRHIPYDPYLYFNGEEISYAIRLFTHGYELAIPHRPFMYHAYRVGEEARRLNWQDTPSNLATLNKLALARVKHLLQIERSNDPLVLKDIQKYSLGTVRSLEDWEYYTGINLRSRALTDQAQEGKVGR